MRDFGLLPSPLLSHLLSMLKRPYADLHAWQLAHRLALDVDAACTSLPARETYGLGSQLRRSARSVPANIVEGKGAFGPRVYLRHVQIALGSACELDYHLLFAKDRHYLDGEICDDLRKRAWALRGLLLSLARSLRKASKQD
jgi:four helix bundle protein